MSLYQGWDPPRPGWVCSQCGFDYDATPPSLAMDLLAGLLTEYRSRLSSNAEALRARPEPSTWSALEYACHVRDCLELYDSRIRKVLAEDRPALPQMRRDAIVIEREYNKQVPALVVRDLDTNYGKLRELLQQVSEADWQRVGVRAGEDLSVEWMVLNTLHEARHHLMDVDSVFAARRAGTT